MSLTSMLVRCALVSITCLVLYGCSQRAEKRFIVDAKAVANKQAKEVEAILGKPDSTYHLQILGRQIFCQWYRSHEIEIQYPNGKASEIVVYKATDVPFTQQGLENFNMDYRTNHPTDYKKNRYIRWTDFEEFATITFYNPKVDSANEIESFNVYFKVREL